ncbi:hypothetical protein E1B28_009579 [Marasmius oreades]|uniref:F-box domain-containing protein n=1 Tax=Marasmius oreades TaxID=181124 RepID=A0A9P7RWU7_9AGAR|nr:uncharacterized protein E1B28_009579 [Marasmius oreades]KAG7090463.1 hypothetical protein E1B28_009579 [Marasmius oreades]
MFLESLLVHKLPLEILSTIFSIATHLSDDPVSAISVPLSISHVCARWRKVSLSTGSLWTRLALFFPAIDPAQLTRTICWLNRSKSYPLEILLDLRYSDWDWPSSGDGHPFTGEMLQVLLTILLPHVQRWKTFEMLTDTWEPIHTFLTRIRDTPNLKAPMLQSLALSRCNAYFVRKGEVFQPIELKEPIPLISTGMEAEGLRDVLLAGVHVDWTKSRCFRNLLDLTLKFHSADVMPSFPEFKNMLDACPDLESLTILGWGPSLDPNSDENSTSQTKRELLLRLPTLKRFSHGFVDVDYAVDFLALFRLPSLRALELQDITANLNEDPSIGLDATPVLEWLISNGAQLSDFPSIWYPLCQVERLELEGIKTSQQVFSRFLRAFTSLKKLCLSDVDSNLLSALYARQDEETVPSLPGPIVVEGRERRRSSFASVSLTPAPLLTCPHLVDMVCRRVDYKYLSKIISARCKVDSGVKPLETLEIDSGGEGSEGSSFALREEDREAFLKAGVGLLVNGEAR